MTVLVDTSIWVGHFRKSDTLLMDLLEGEQVLAHPFIVGELACGNIRHRKEIVELLMALPSASKADDSEVLFLIEERRLMGRGLGLIDVHLLASCLTDRCQLWTADKALAAAASQLGVGWGQSRRPD